MTWLLATARTMSSACSIGTPLRNRTPSVRPKRATSVSRSRLPTIGMRSLNASNAIRCVVEK